MNQETNDFLPKNTTNDPLIELNEVLPMDLLEQRSASTLTLKSTNLTTSSRVIHHFTGIAYALIASCLFTCSGFIIKQLRVDFFDALLVRFFLQTVTLLIIILYKKIPFIQGSTNYLLLQIFRAIISCSGVLLFYASYRYIPLPDVTTCRYTQVAWTAFIVMIIFRERISLITVLAIICTLTGVIFVAQPTFLFPKDQILFNQTLVKEFEADSSQRFLGLSLALICALSISFGMVLNKKLLVSNISEILVLFQLTILNFSVVTIYHLYSRFILLKYAHQTMFTWNYLIAASVSLLQILSSILTQKAVKLEHPSIISVVQSSDIIYAIILQNVFAKVKSNLFIIIGAFLVTTSIFLVGMQKFCQDAKKLKEKKTNIPDQ